MNQKEQSLYIFLSAVFVASLVTAGILASKIISLWGVFVPAGVLAYSITFTMTDTICEVWGKERAQSLVRSGFLVLLLVWGLNALAIALPPAPFWSNQKAFSEVLGSTNRIILASLVAYGISQTFDLWIYNQLRTLTSSRMLWLRNNVSTLLSQTLDTVVFITIAFYGKMPLAPLIMGQLTIKYLIALMDTPLVYLMVYGVRLRLGRWATTQQGAA